MKKFLSIFLCLAMMISCFALASCDTEDKVEEPETETKAEETTKETESSDDEKKISVENLDDVLSTLEGGDEVTDLDGKSAKELYRAAYNTVQNMTQYAFNVNQTTKDSEGATRVSKVEGEVSATSAHLKQTNSSGTYEGWHVNGTSYYAQGTSKTKGTEDMPTFLKNIPALVKSMVVNISDEVLDEAKLLKIDEIYYIEIVATAEEAVEMNLGQQAFTYKTVFDADGNIVGVYMKTDSAEITFTLSATADVPAVSAPADADAYTENTSSGTTGGSASSGTSSGSSSGKSENSN